MAATNFNRALKRILLSEGGKVDDPRDPGGRTNQGVTQHVYDAYREKMNASPRDVFKMALVERDAIYRAQYWAASRADDLPSGVDLVVFDGAVNSGVTQSVKWLQRALAPHGYSGPADGHIGLATVAAANAHPDKGQLVADIGEARLRFMKSLKIWKHYRNGWTARVKSVTAAGQNWSVGQFRDASITPHFYTGDAKPVLEGNADRSPKAMAEATSGAGGLTTVLAQTTDALMPLSYSSEKVNQIILILTLLGVAVTVGGVVWGLVARRRDERRADDLQIGVA